ncbi:MAG TPA: hypothetical protein EYO02_06440 [Rhodospirillales bacterium]|nr:hypothetical protein [Rhodospirillales bacterium]
MKIKCPKCSTSYVIDGISKVIIRRLLRCSTCGHNWRQNLTLSEQSLTSKTLHHVFDPLHFEILQYAHQTFYKPHPDTVQETKDNSNSGTRNEHSSMPPVSPSQSETSSKTSLSQCVFCQRSSRCNLHDLYSGRRH